MANSVPVKSDLHKNLKVSSKRDLSHVAKNHIVPVTAVEFSQASASYPIVFIKNGEGKDQYRSVAMLGLEQEENLYLDGENWQGTYVPQSISLVPFSLGLDPEKEKTLTPCINLDSPFVGEDKEQALFDDKGEATDFYKSVEEALGTLYDNEMNTGKFIQELADNDLLLELELKVALNTGENKRLVGLYGINEPNLHKLSDEKVIDFHKRGLFIPIYAMLSSLTQVNRLAQLRNRSEAEVKVSGISISPLQEKDEQAA